MLLELFNLDLNGLYYSNGGTPKRFTSINKSINSRRLVKRDLKISEICSLKDKLRDSYA
jgi:hypothetical protein